MQPVDSNYPREFLHPASQVNLKKLTAVAILTVTFGLAHVLAFVALSIVMALQYQSALANAAIFPVTCFWFGLGFVAHVALSAWTARAISDLALLSSVESRFSKLLTYFCLVFFPTLLHAYAMDFVDLRSSRSTKSTMKWYTPYSKSAPVNLLLAFYSLAIVLLGFPSFLAAYPLLKQGHIFFGLVSVELALLVHLSLVWIVQRRIRGLVLAQTQRS